MDIADRNSQRVTARPLYEIGHHIRIRPALCLIHHVLLFPLKCAKLGFHRNPIEMAVFGGPAALFYVFLKGKMGGVNHDGGKSCIHACLDVFKGFTVIQMESDGSF